MKNSRLFGSVRNNIIIGAALVLLGLVVRTGIFRDLLPSPLYGLLRGVDDFIYPLRFLLSLFMGPRRYSYDPPIFVLDALGWLVVAAGIVAVVVGIAMYGGQKGWWSGLDDEAKKAVRIATMVLGILGSVVTFLFSVLVVTLGGFGTKFEDEGYLVFAGWLVVLSSVIALLGAILTHGSPRVGAKLLGIAAIPCILFTFAGVGMFFGLGTLLLVIATVLAFIDSRQAEVESA